MKSKTIKVDYLARVEGEGSLYVRIRNDQAIEAQLKIFEPPRFFEAFLRGRSFEEAPDITARICGICPVAYQMSAVQAMEDALGITIDPAVRQLRRLLYCGEWIESHVLHVYLLHAPDFLGYPDAIAIAKDHPEIVKQALQLKKIGNQIVSVVGGREIHPINVRVGGFYRLPEREELNSLVEKLKWARDAALQMVAWSATLTFPDFEQDYQFVALRHPDEYAVICGRLVSSRGLDIEVRDYEQHFEEEHLERSNALHSFIKGKGPYLTGPLARFNINFDKLAPTARDAARDAGIGPGCRNPFKSIIVRSVETVHALEEALQLIAQYQPPESAAAPLQPRAGTGYACTEAPRGTLYHRYSIDDNGLILNSKIVPPTAQNLKMIEVDLQEYISQHLDLSAEKLTWQCEQVIRNYDPCISCATHFLKLHLDRC
jgi:sulfhydrogenase subunit alpha